MRNGRGEDNARTGGPASDRPPKRTNLVVGRLRDYFQSRTRHFDERGINAGVDDATAAARGTGSAMSGWHSGQIQTYLRAIGVSLLALLADPEFVYLVADSEEIDTGRMRFAPLISSPSI